MKKIVLKLELHDEGDKNKVMKAVSRLSASGIESISVEMKAGKLTVVGDIDPVYVVKKFRKFCRLEILSVAPAKDDEKKKEEKEKDKDKDKESHLACSYYYPNYYCRVIEENPNACIIC